MMLLSSSVSAVWATSPSDDVKMTYRWNGSSVICRCQGVRLCRSGPLTFGSSPLAVHQDGRRRKWLDKENATIVLGTGRQSISISALARQHGAAYTSRRLVRQVMMHYGWPTSRDQKFLKVYPSKLSSHRCPSQIHRPFVAVSTTNAVTWGAAVSESGKLCQHSNARR